MSPPIRIPRTLPTGAKLPPVRVAVPLEMCWHAVPGGTARVAIDMAAALDRRDDVEVIGVAARHRTPPETEWVPTVEVRHLPVPRRILYETWHAFRWPDVDFATGPIDVVHAFGGAVPSARHAPLVAMVHDLAFRHHPDKFTRNGLRFFNRALDLMGRYAAAITCPSEATLEDCAAHGIGRDRLHLVPNAVEVERPGDDVVEAVRRRFGLDSPYVLFVGTLEPRKNLAGLLAAWQTLDRGDHRLVVVGPDGWGDLGTGLPADVVRTGFVDRETRDALYVGATVSVYPSLFEGFGLPVLESMALGCPVVTSAGTATQELVRDGGGIAVDPERPQDIAAAIEAVIHDADRRDDLAASALDIADRYTWDRSAALVADIYRQVT